MYVWITCTNDVSKDYSEVLGPKHKSELGKTESVLLWQNTFEIFLLGLFIRIGEKLFQCYIQKSFLVIGDYKKIWNRAKFFFFVRPQYY